MNSVVTQTILHHFFKCQAHTVSAETRAHNQGWKSVIAIIFTVTKSTREDHELRCVVEMRTV